MGTHRHPGYDFWKNEERMTNRIWKCIEANLDLRDELALMQQQLGGKGKAKEVIAEALKSKDFGDGYNVLMHAASVGHDVSFSSAVDVITERLGRIALIKQLRESDIHGAPLPFQAARSSSRKCFETVCETIRSKLGDRELKQQLQAVDLKERTIIFHAAKGQKEEVFKAVVQAFNQDVEGSTDTSDDPQKSWLLAKEGQEVYRRAHERRVATICRRKVFVDYKGMNILHVACRWGCPVVIDTVILEAERLGQDFLQKLLRTVTKAGRTPLMEALRHNCSTCDSGPHAVDNLLGALVYSSDTEYDEKLELLTRPATRSSHTTALTHGAYGGPKHFGIVLRTIYSVAKSQQSSALSDVCHDDGGLHLDFALGIADQDRTTKTSRYGALLAAAASGGYPCVLEDVVSAIKTGVLRQQRCRDLDDLSRRRRENREQDDRVKAAIEAVNDSRGTLFSVVISSRSTEAAKRVIELIKAHISNPIDVWNVLRGHEDGISNLALAASIPEIPSEPSAGTDMFRVVCAALEQAAEEAHQFLSRQPSEEEHPGDFANHVRALFSPDTRSEAESMRAPLTMSMLSRNEELFKAVYSTFNRLSEICRKPSWTRRQVVEQIPTGPSLGPEGANKWFLAAFSGAVFDAGISPTMLLATMEAFQLATPASNESAKRAEDLLLSQRTQRLVQAAAELGAFDLFRFNPFFHETIPCLLERIGDFEDNIVDAVLLAVISARNPFIMCAVVSKYISKAEIDLPMHRIGLRNLQSKMDVLTLEIFNALPHTVQGLGLEFGAHDPVLLKLKKSPETQKKHGRLAAKMGFVVVQWILEPSTVRERASEDQKRPETTTDKGTDESSRPAWLPSWESPELIDPLQRALDRGSQALDFVNTPLVLDYMLLKFSGTLPPWTSRSPFTYNMGEKFYTHTLRDSKDPYRMFEDKAFHELKPADLLLRFLQGYAANEKGHTKRLRLFRVPHVTLLPGLQFTLGGIIGAPATYYEVPAIRFAYELLGYIAMMGLFCSCVKIADPAFIPINEICFYTSVLGLLWREVLEFREVLPVYRGPGSSDNKASSRHVSGTIIRYLFQDAWNILDVSTILFVGGAFTLRMVNVHAQREDGGGAGLIISPNTAGFLAQVLLAISALPLFARILSLSQIDNTLGPMTQIIWKMLSHLAKFSVFVAVLIASFALAFHAVFHTCEEGNLLHEEYGTFTEAYLTMFRAMLGDFAFDSFKSARTCDIPPWTERFGVFFLVLYLAISSVLLLNLLIAVLSTAHAEVYANAEKEFHLARAKLIQQSWRAVLKGRQPPPINLLMPVMGLMADLVGVIGRPAWDAYKVIARRFNTTGTAAQDAQDAHDGRVKPISETYLWDVWLGAVHRGIFAAIVGPLAVGASAALWVASSPWLAWRILRWRFPRTQSHSYWSAGYWRPLVAMMVKVVGWVVALSSSAVVSVACSLGSVALWFCGIWGIGRWWKNEIVSKKKGTRPRQRDWVFAETTVSERHGGDLGDGERQFRVDLLLKETTGLDVEDLSLRIKSRERAALMRANGNQDPLIEDLGSSLPRQLSSSSGISSIPSSTSMSAVGAVNNQETSASVNLNGLTRRAVSTI